MGNSYSCDISIICLEKKSLLRSKTILLDQDNINNNNVNIPVNSTSNILSLLPELVRKNNRNENINNFNNINDSQESQKNSKDVLDKYFNLPKRNNDNFDKDFLVEINKLRINPNEFSIKIDNYVNSIKFNLFTKEKYFLFDNYPIYLNIGEKELFNCSNFLKNKPNDNNLKELEIIEELKIPFPEFINNWDNSNYINKELIKLREKIKDKYTIIEFDYYKTIPSAEISTILSIFNQDNNIEINKNLIFSKEVKYVGINFKSIDEVNICLYLIFAK